MKAESKIIRRKTTIKSIRLKHIWRIMKQIINIVSFTHSCGIIGNWRKGVDSRFKGLPLIPWRFMLTRLLGNTLKISAQIFRLIFLSYKFNWLFCFVRLHPIFDVIRSPTISDNASGPTASLCWYLVSTQTCVHPNKRPNVRCVDTKYQHKTCVHQTKRPKVLFCVFTYYEKHKNSTINW